MKASKIRLAVQLFFAGASIYTGWRFILFVRFLEGKGGFAERPPGVEAFLPLSALISLKYWILTGVFNKVHPAALVLLLAFLTMALLFKKGFCSWVCPFGLLSEYLWKLGRWIFGKNLDLPRFIDYPLRSLKYLLAGFFLWGIFVEMGVEQLREFIYGPYNAAADIKMLLFFRDMSSTTFWVLVALVLLSVLIKNFWCRYLCPYGALLGFLSLFSPMKIKRNEKLCTNCRLCTLACSSRIQVHTLKVVRSDECHACMRCTDVCPVDGALELKAAGKKLSPALYAAGILLIFLLFTGVARILGYWHNSISLQQYKSIMKEIHLPKYSHPGSR